MKKDTFTQKTHIMGVAILLSLAIILVLFTTCDIGLGQIVNTEKPVINSAGDNPPGTFLQGTDNKIALDVSNKLGFKIVEVWMDIDYTDKDSKFPATKRVDAQQDPETGEWFVILDTSDMADGKISGKVTAKDESGNTTTTTEMIYNVKNTPPQIKLNMPLVDSDDWDNDDFLASLKINDPLFLGFDLLGLATDDYGIAEGYPQIMIWPANEPNLEVDEDGIPTKDNSLYGTWYELVVPNRRAGLTATKFSWPMMNLIEDPENSGKYRLPTKNDINRSSLNEGIYRIRIKTKDLFGVENEYPNKTDTTRSPDNPSLKYIEINYKASDVPIVQITEAQSNYNTVKDFEIYFSISSKNPVDNDTIEAFIVDGNNGNENISGGAYTPVFIESSNSLYKYKLTITSAQAKAWTNIPEKGLMYVRIKATAGDKTGPNAYHNFIYDIEPPDVIIDRPVNLQNTAANGSMNGGTYTILYPAKDRPKWVTGIITVGGTAKDNFTLKEVYYHIGKLDDDKKTAAQRDEIFSEPSNWTNTNLHLSTPVYGWKGSPYSWTYTFNVFDNDYKNTPEGALLIQEYDDLLSAYLDKNQYSITVAEPGAEEKARFYLPLYVKVTDSAENFRIIHYKLSIDPKLDEPFVTITQPEIKEFINDKPVPPVVGGTVRIAGSAEDNYWMHTVLVRVKKDDGIYPAETITDNGYYIPTTTPPVAPFYPSNPTYPKPKKGALDDTDGWFLATKVGDSNNVNWYANINQDRKLEPANSGDPNVPVTVEVIAIDCDEGDSLHTTPHIVGPIEKLSIAFSKDVPMIYAKLLKTGVPDRDYTEGIRASGKFTFSFKVDAIKDINSLTARINGASTPINLIVDTSSQSVDSTVWKIGPKITNGDKIERTITVIIDSTKNEIPGLGSTAKGFPYGKTGDLTLEIMAEDATTNHLTTTNTFIIGIDNFYPTAVITTLNVASDNPDKGKYFYISGHAKDYADGTGNVQGLERILVYFEKANITYIDDVRTVTGRNNLYVRPSKGGVLGESEFIKYPDVLDHHGASTSTVLAPNTPTLNWFPKYNEYTYNDVKKWDSVVALTIDYQEGGGISNSDNDHTYGETWEGPSSDVEFGARVDFEDWKDGPYIVHYLIMDKAGNASHYQHDIYLENNKPRIKGINFGTDITGDGLVNSDDNEYLYSSNMVISEPTGASIAGVLTPSFRIRGGLFQVNLEVVNGNGNNRYKVTYVTEAGTVNASTMKIGYVYTIVDQAPGSGAMTDFTKFGAPNNIPGTTFVAAAPATGTGTVISYNEKTEGSYGLTNTGGSIAFNHFSGGSIPDSPKDTDGNILAPHNERFFIIKVYDTTVSAANQGAPDEVRDQLADVILVKVDIDNNDNKKPSINVLPFGFEYEIPVGTKPENDATKRKRALPFAEYNKNIRMNGTVKEGYVQYANDNVPVTTIANISGKVKFLGKAEDNQRIGSIWVKIDGYRNGDTAAYGDYFQVAHVVGKSLVVNNPAKSGEWSFNKLNDDYLTLEYGHALNWEFMWDSSKHQNIAKESVDVTFEIRDVKGNLNTDPITVNIVPYISEVVTSLSGTYYMPSVFNRSALGGYPVREGETITIKGFNLGKDDLSNTTVTVNSALTASLAKPPTITDGIKITVSGVDSGPLNVTVNGIESFNNSPLKNKTTSYNKEPNGVNNNMLDNNRYIYVWNTGYLYNEDIPYITNPFMRMDDNGNRLLSFGFYDGQSRGRLKVRKNNANIILGTSYSNRMVYTTVAASKGNNSFYAAGSDLSSQNNRGFQLGKSNAGGTNNATNQTVNDAAAGNTTATGSISLYGMASSNPDRFRIPRIAVQASVSGSNRRDATSDRILISYFDNESAKKEVRIIYGAVGANTGATADTGANNAADNNTGNITTAAFANQPTTAGVVSVLVASNDTTHNGSMYTAVGFLKDGEPLIAWYDDAHQNLIFSFVNKKPTSTNYSNNFITTTQSDWTDNAKVIAEGKGTHVDMAVDENNNVHLAYYSDDGGLWYTYIPSNDVLNISRSMPKSVRVDTFLSAGTKIMINIRDGIPYISYAHASFPGTRHSIRVAWRLNTSDVTADGTNEDDTFTGKWEVMTVPVRSNVIPNIDEFICNGVPTSGNLTAPAGGADSLTYSSALSQTILVGFMTNLSYEGAVLKDNILTVPIELKK